MSKIAVTYPPIRTLLADPEMNKFRRLLGDSAVASAIDPFLDALDRPDVVLGMMLAPAFGIPGIVPACITLRGNRAFDAAVAKNDNLKKCLGTVTKLRARSLGLVKTGHKGRVGQWIAEFTVAEIYQPTAALWSALSFTPPLPKGANVFNILSQDEGRAA